MSARPLPYSEESSTTKTFLAFTTSWMYFAAAGPWVASLPSMRKKVFQPCCESVGLVADGVMVVRPALAKIGSAALDSPENAGPTMPMTFLSLTAFCASAGACAGSPWLSKVSRVTLQLACFSLYCFTARSAPFLMLMPRLAASPVSAPKKPILRSQALPPADLSPEDVVPPQALSASAAATTGTPNLMRERKTPPEVTWARARCSTHWVPHWGG